jgi:hypothetical protein
MGLGVGMGRRTSISNQIQVSHWQATEGTHNWWVVSSIKYLLFPNSRYISLPTVYFIQLYLSLQTSKLVWFKLSPI